MAINIDNWSTNAALNTTVEGEDLGEGCAPAGLNDFLRKAVAAIRVFRNVSYCIDKNVTFQASGGALPTGVQVGHLLIEY